MLNENHLHSAIPVNSLSRWEAFCVTKSKGNPQDLGWRPLAGGTAPAERPESRSLPSVTSDRADDLLAAPRTRLVLICGLPASGKSTLARQLAPKIPAVRLDKDRWVTELGADLWDEEFRVRLEHQLWILSLDLLAQGQSVILEWGHWRRSSEMRSDSGRGRWA